MSIQYTAEQLRRKFPGPAGAPGFPRLADVLRAEGRTDEAIELCREGLRSDPGALSGYLVLGKTLVETGRMEEAQEQFEAALRIDPRCLSAMHQLARIMDQMQWSEAAAGYYRSILEVEPWDDGVRAQLEASGLARDGGSIAESSTARHEFAPIVDAPARGAEDTYEKPEGFSGDVLEVSLNDLAEDFLPDRDGADMGFAEESLEDALSMPREEERPVPLAAATVAIPEPVPQDILKEEPEAPSESPEEGAAPFSGQDVEDRLDSLFGSEDGPAVSGPSPTSTWTAAPAEADPAPETHEVTAGFPEPEAVRQPDPLVPSVPEESLYHDEPAEVFGETALAAAPEAPVSGDDAEDEEPRVQGDDIEKRLDELFNLAGEEAPVFPAATALPVAPAPRIEEAVYLGETVSFGGEASEEDSGPAAETAGAETAGAETAGAETAGAETAGAETAALEPAALEPAALEPAALEPAALEPAGAETADAAGAETENPVTGQDVADKLDRLFGIEAAGQAAVEHAEARAAEVRERDALIGASGATEAFLKTDLEDMEMPAIDMPPPSDSEQGDETMLTTVSLPPAGRPEETESGSGVTGEDVEAQLDRLFGLTGEGDAFNPDPAPNADLSYPPHVEGGDRTMIMPAFHQPADEASVTADEEELFGALAPEEHGELSDTATIEMVDGADVAERLDRLFAAGDGEMSLFPGDGGEPAFPLQAKAVPTAPLEVPEDDTMVSGEDVSARLSEMFEPEADAVKADAGTLSVPAQAGSPPPSGFAPMSDDEDGYPEEEELPPQEGPAANVATVTLAEIYFQQGLKEQALQIYRQLLEREPENESVRGRIEEIEASKPEDGDRGPGTDQRRPRPGLKVPKRKK